MYNIHHSQMYVLETSFHPKDLDGGCPSLKFVLKLAEF